METDVAETPLRRQGLFLCESEIARRLGVSEKRWREIRARLEREEGLPQIHPLLGGRCWPAVEAWCISLYKSGGMVAAKADGEEKWD